MTARAFQAAAAALAAALLLLGFLTLRAEATLEAERAGRAAVVRAVAAAEAAARLEPGDEAARARLVADLAAGGADLRLIDPAARRVIEASGPRPMAEADKPLYDRALDLAAAAQTNRAEGVGRKDEIVVTRTAEGVRAGAPVGPEGSRGSAEALQPVDATRAALTVVVLAAVFAAGVAAAWAAAVGLRRLKAPAWSVGLAALVIAAGGVLVGGLLAETRLAEAARAAPDAAAAEAARVSAVLGAAAPDAWNLDRLRRPRAELDPGGRVVPEAAQARAERARAAVRDTARLCALLAVAVGLVFTTGLAERAGRTLRAHRLAYGYVAPALVALLALVCFPFLYGVVLSFTGTTLFNESLPLADRWVGLDNYARILGDFSVIERAAGGAAIDYDNFYWTLFVTVAWTVTNVGLGVAIGLSLALLLNTPNLRFKGVYRVLLILPWAVPNYITALTWKALFHPQFGAVNQVVQIAGGAPVDWFGGVFTSFMTGVAANAWLSFPFMLVVSLGALQSINPDMYEAARLEGASRRQQFLHVTLPALKPALLPAVLLSVVWTFNMFNVIYLVSGGEPAGANEILITKAFKIGFEDYQYGMAAAYSMIIFLLLLGYGVAQVRATLAKEVRA